MKFSDVPKVSAQMRLFLELSGKRQIQACGALLRLLTNLSMQKIFSMGGLRSEIGYRDPHESTSSMGG